jgi:gas vesicle protein
MISARATPLRAAGNSFPERKPRVRLPLYFSFCTKEPDWKFGLEVRLLTETEDDMTAKRNWTESISAFAVGIGVGAALGVLFAPRSGNDARDYLVETAQEHLDGAIAAGHKITQRAQEGIDQIKGQVRQAADVGERAYREAKNSSA